MGRVKIKTCSIRFGTRKDRIQSLYPIRKHSRNVHPLTVDDHGLVIFVDLNRLQSISLHQLVQLIQELPRVDPLILPMKVLDLLEPNVELAEIVLSGWCGGKKS